MGTHQHGDPLYDFAAMHQEHAAWTQGVVGEFDRLNMDMSDPRYTILVRAIEAWGEELSWLRMRQDDKTRADAYNAKLQAFVDIRPEPIPQGVGTIWDRLVEEKAQTQA